MQGSGTVTESVAGSFPFLRAERLLFAAALLVLALCPFEGLEPLASFPGQKITNVELALLILLAGFAVLRLLQRKSWISASGLTLPALVLLAVLLLSALLAPEHQANALKSWGRLAAGFLFFSALAGLLSSRARLRAALATVAAAASAVSLLGILEFLQTPGIEQVLSPFRDRASYAGALPRAGSSLQYPNIAAMYLEVAFALTWGLGLELGRKGRIWASRASLASCSLMGVCIVLTLSRAGILVLAALAILAAWQGLRQAPRAGRLRLLTPFLAAAAAVALLAGVSQDYRFRLLGIDASQWYRAAYRVPQGLQMEAGRRQAVAVSLTNEGLALWRSQGASAVRLSYHWFSQDGSTLHLFDGLRTELPIDLAPGDSAAITAQVEAPAQPGAYRLVWDLVCEDRFWFSKEGSGVAHTPVEVIGASAEAGTPSAQTPPRSRFRPGRWELWGIALQMFLDRPLLGVGPDNFRLLYGRYGNLPDWDWSYHAHSMYLETLAAGGLLGAAAFLWLLVCWIRLSALTLSAARRRAEWLSTGAAGASMAILLHGFLDHFWSFTPIYLTIWTAIAVTASLSRLGRNED